MKDGALARLNDPDVRDGIRILAVNGHETDTFDEISDLFNEDPSRKVELTIALADRDEQKKVTVQGQPLKMYELGFSFLFDYQTRKLNVPDAIKAGFNCSIYMIKTCYLTLSRIITGDVASKNLGGIITISRASYSFAELGFAKLFFFLAILSINLGFLNVLPIPMLDGGHLLFLLIEKIKGSPVSEKVMGYSQVVGLAFILALLIYVTYNDILRLL
jgi:RIP metalloprotease RseP